tara:strand:- start:45 stop:506 length:462 start_codon:yes stop_codon:yes gene_type:complete
MAKDMDTKKGLYPDEPGYRDWNSANFSKEMEIEGTVTKQFKYITPTKFHTKLMKTGHLPLTEGVSYPDIKIRNDIEMTNHKRYFQPKAWNTEKLMYNYDALYHLWYMEQNFNTKYFELKKWETHHLKKHLKSIYFKYKVEDKDQLKGETLDEV